MTDFTRFSRCCHFCKERFSAWAHDNARSFVHTSDEEGVMWEFRHKLRTLVSGLLEPRRTARRVLPSRSTDWLPPVLGPEDYSIGMMSDRSASWYLDRGSA